MKLHTNLLNYCLLVTLLIFSSCQDEEEASRRDMLIGTWEIQSGELFDYNLTVSGVPLTRSAVQGLAALNADLAEIDKALEDGADILFPAGTTIMFNDDNTYLVDDQTDVVDGSWSLSDDEQTITVQSETAIGTSELNFTIETFTEQQIGLLLVLDRDDINLESQGIDELPAEIEDFTIEYKFNFTKQ
ncbi:MAG: hypothetical protein RIG62_08525 [Cyclobacteriaceae bacterium]